MPPKAPPLLLGEVEKAINRSTPAGRRLQKPQRSRSGLYHGDGAMKIEGMLLEVEHPTSPQAALMGPLRLLTFNIWFDELAKKERGCAVVDILKQNRANVICLQEVTPRALEVFLQDEWVAANCCVVDPHCKSFAGYGVTMIASVPLENVMYWRFANSTMGRGLLSATVVANGKPVQVGTVHLESLSNARRRKEQLLFSASLLEAGGGPAVLCGDFNFDSTRNFKADGRPLENKTLELLTAWEDAWAARHPGEPGWTFDTATNKMLEAHARETMRYDRILSFGVSPTSIDLVGKTPIVASEVQELYPYFIICDRELSEKVSTITPQERDEHEHYQRFPIYPSDHYGLFAVFDL